MIYKNLIESYNYSVQEYSDSRYHVCCNICGHRYKGTITDFRYKDFKCIGCVERQKMKEIEANGFAILGKEKFGYIIECVNCNTTVVKKYNTIRNQKFRCITCDSVKYKEKIKLSEDKDGVEGEIKNEIDFIDVGF